MNKTIKIITHAIFLLIICSCHFYKPSFKNPYIDPLPPKYSIESAPINSLEPWWESFNDDELNGLIRQAIKQNKSIEVAFERLKQTRALAVIANAARFPDLAGKINASHIRREQRLNEDSSINSFGLSLLSSYEFDLWGRVRAGVEMAKHEIYVNQLDWCTAVMSLSAEIANNWIKIIANRMERQLLEKQMQTNRTLLDLIELRFNKGMVTALDVYQQRQVLETLLTEFPSINAEERLLLNDISILTGQLPNSEIVISRNDLPDWNDNIATGKPMDLITNRPDIQAASIRLKISDWQLAQAYANRLPIFSLSPSVSLESSNIKYLFDNFIFSIVSGMVSPLFDAKKRKAEVIRVQSIVNERKKQLENSILSAINEVENALVAVKSKKTRIHLLKQVIETSNKAFEEAMNRYRNGLSDYLPVLTQLLKLHSIERDMIKEKMNLSLSRISLYRAIGGNYSDIFFDYQYQ